MLQHQLLMGRCVGNSGDGEVAHYWLHIKQTSFHIGSILVSIAIVYELNCVISSFLSCVKG